VANLYCVALGPRRCEPIPPPVSWFQLAENGVGKCLGKTVNGKMEDGQMESGIPRGPEAAVVIAAVGRVGEALGRTALVGPAEPTAAAHHTLLPR